MKLEIPTCAIGWVITHDILFTPVESIPSRTGWGGYRRDDGYIAIRTGLAATEVTDPVEFRLFDDDGEPYYRGVIARSWLDSDEMFAFHPLTWAAHDAGCTIIKILEQKRWVTL